MRFSTELLLARQVWDTAFRTRAVVALFVLVGLAGVAATWLGWTTYRQQEATRAHYQQAAREDWLGNPDKHPHRMAHYGHFAFRARSPLSMLDRGMDPFLGNAIYLEAHQQNTVNFSEAEFSTGLVRFGEFSLALLLQLLLPLLIFFLGAGSVAADRENGTLRLLMSQGASPLSLLVGKSLGLWAVIMVLFIPLMGLAAVGWLLARPGPPPADEVFRLLVLAGTYGWALLLYCVLAVGVSAVSRTVKTAWVMLIGFWLVSLMIVPRVGQAIGAALYPLPSRTEFQAAIQADLVQAGDSHNPDDPHYQALRDSLLTAYNVDSVVQLPFNYSGYVMAEGEKISAALYQRHYARLLAQIRRQNRVAQAFVLFSPYVALKPLSMALTGTDFTSYVAFQQQAEAYRYALAQRMNELQIRLISNRPHAGENPILNHEHWQELPDFEPQLRPLAALFPSAWFSLGALVGWGLALAGGLFWIAHRFSPV
ncbi:ABC-2 type transport system permease protein [Catalinimonas alkaloidigena]|uniref:ABC-2 type transport system permease protein n=1 Tax=Catalinimonas alkaloidigena TaxID=1075417 RepID=A0A1G9VDP1_9BACT|nr:DUF3526 domain-containing protein [Catalinimonas alkaloidigena]SDM70200.1 ABC-2 type transport system permease protein [Catalinimonas alkaloidigena]